MGWESTIIIHPSSQEKVQTKRETWSERERVLYLSSIAEGASNIK